MAHADEDPKTGVFTGITGCSGIQGNYHLVFTIDPSTPTTRKTVAKIHLPNGRSASYMHSMAGTPNYVTLIADPLYMSPPDYLILFFFLRGKKRALWNESKTCPNIFDISS